MKPDDFEDYVEKMHDQAREVADDIKFRYREQIPALLEALGIAFLEISLAYDLTLQQVKEGFDAMLGDYEAIIKEK